MNRISVIQNWQPWSWMILFQTFWVQSKNSIYISRLYEFETWRRNQFSITVSSRQTSYDCAGKCCVFVKRRRGFHRVFNSVSCSLTFFTCVAKYLKDKKHNSVYFARKYVQIYLSLDIICTRSSQFPHLGTENSRKRPREIFALILAPNWSNCLI